MLSIEGWGSYFGLLQWKSHLLLACKFNNNCRSPLSNVNSYWFESCNRLIVSGILFQEDMPFISGCTAQTNPMQYQTKPAAWWVVCKWSSRLCCHACRARILLCNDTFSLPIFLLLLTLVAGVSSCLVNNYPLHKHLWNKLCIIVGTHHTCVRTQITSR